MIEIVECVQGYLHLKAIGNLSLGDASVVTDAFVKSVSMGPFGVVTDTTELVSAPLPVLSEVGYGFKMNSGLKKNWLADAILVKPKGFFKSTATNFGLSHLHLIAPMPEKVETFSDMIKAHRYLLSVFRDRGLTPPSVLQRAA